MAVLSFPRLAVSILGVLTGTAISLINSMMVLECQGCAGLFLMASRATWRPLASSWLPGKHAKIFPEVYASCQCHGTAGEPAACHVDILYGHTGSSLRPLPQTHCPGHAAGKAVSYGLGNWAPAIRGGDQDGLPGSDMSVVAIWRVDQ